MLKPSNRRLLVIGAASILLLGGCAGRQVLSPEVKVAPGKEQKMLTGRLVPMRDQIVVWFVKPEAGALTFVPVERPYKGQNTRADYLDFALKELARGPNGTESASGIGSEIPAGTVLVDVKNLTGGAIAVNLSKHFVQGGGLESFETRMEQLKRTVKDLAFDRKVYLEIKGSRLTRTVGEGVEIKQPIN